MAAGGAQKAKNDYFSKKAKKAYLKAEFDMSYEAQNYSAQKITIRKCPYQCSKSSNFASKKHFSMTFTIRVLILGPLSYRSWKTIDLKQNFQFLGFVMGILFW